MVEKKPVKKTVKKVVEKKVATTEDKILGNVVEDVVKTVVAYEDKSIKYKVTNLKVNNGAEIFDGTMIETFIGSNNKEARLELINGAKKVITKNGNGEDAYKIEVV